MKKIFTLAAIMLLQACSSDDDNENLPYPVLSNDNQAAIDLNRGDYQCFQISTSEGDIKLALDSLYAPSTTENFSTYVMAGFYDGLIFHRVIKGFMIQGGGLKPGLQAVGTMPAIDSESKNGLKNYRGRIAMARTSYPHSATSQFFINTVDNHFLNAGSASDGWGYTVFGGVIEGMDVVDAIASVPTGSVSGLSDVPVEDVLINSVTDISCPTE